MSTERRDRVSPSDPSADSSDSASGGQGIELTPDALSPEALRGLVEEFVSREGTDYGHVDRSLESKVTDVYRQLETGDATIVFDLETQSASIVSTRDLASQREH